MDSGSEVTALSGSFYQALVKAGAPVGALRPTPRRLRGANGSHMLILCGVVPGTPDGISHSGVQFGHRRYYWDRYVGIDITTHLGH